MDATMQKYQILMIDTSINLKKVHHIILVHLCLDTMTALVYVLKEQMIIRLHHHQQHRQAPAKVKVSQSPDRADFLQKVDL